MTCSDGAGPAVAGSVRLARDGLHATLAAAPQVLGVDQVGLMLLDERGVLRVVGMSDDGSAAVELVQHELGAGPAFDAVGRAEAVPVADLATDHRYHELWRRLVVLRGDGERTGVRVRAVLSVPVPVGGAVIGTLTAVRVRPAAWTGQEIRAVNAFGEVLGALLAAAGTGRSHG